MQTIVREQALFIAGVLPQNLLNSGRYIDDDICKDGLMKYRDFIIMLEQANIKYSTSQDKAGRSRVLIEACFGPNNEGYGGCSSTFTFDIEGTLECTGAWRDAA